MRAAGPIALVLVLCSARAAARADEPWANLGVSEVLLLPDAQHYAVYVYAGAAWPFATGWHDVYVIPGLVLEYAPEVSRGGFIPSVTFERSLGGRVAADLILSLAHDQHNLDFGEAVFSAGVGLGLSISAGDFAISPSCYVYRVLDSPDWSLAPTLNLAHPL